MGMQSEPIVRRKLSDEVFARLKALIEAGELQPGDEMPSERMPTERPTSPTRSGGPASLPAQTLVPVPRLAISPMLFEIEAIVVLG